MVVLGFIGVSKELEVVKLTIPVKRGNEAELLASYVATEGGCYSLDMLILVWILGTIEALCSKALVREPKLQVNLFIGG